MTVSADVAIVGGGPAGASIAAAARRRGPTVVVLERSPAYRWRACGVFASPAAVDRSAGPASTRRLSRRVARPIPAMRVETPAGTSFRLTYGAETAAAAVGFDRSALDPALLDAGRGSGSRRSARLERRPHVDLDGRRRCGAPDGATTVARAIIVGADGRTPSSPARASPGPPGSPRASA